MSTPDKWLDAAALDLAQMSAHNLTHAEWLEVCAQARAALSLRDELNGVREASATELRHAYDELAECRAKLAAQIERCGLAELAVAQRDIPLAAAQAENVRLREAGRDLRLMATTQAPADHPLIVAWDRANADPGSCAALREWGVRLLDFGKFNPKLVSDDFEECRRRGAENCETLERVSRERVVNAMLEGGQS